MRIKAAHAATPAGDALGAMVETEPALVAALPPPLPFHLVAPGTTMNPYDIPAVVVAAVRVRQPANNKFSRVPADILSVAPIKGPTTKKRKGPHIQDGAALRRKNNLPIKPFQMVAPQMAPIGMATPLIVAQNQDMRKGTNQGFQNLSSDGRATMQGMSAGQHPHHGQLGPRPPLPPYPRDSPAVDSSGLAATARAATEGQLEWHPGMLSRNGINYVDAVAAPAGNEAPLLLSHFPPRWVPLRLSNEDMPAFDSEDGARASIDYLRYLAASVGRLPQFPPRLQHSFNAEQRLYRERLARVVLARDGRNVEKMRPEGHRRSNRSRNAPDLFAAADLSHQGGPRGGAIYHHRVPRAPRSDSGAGSGADGNAVETQEPVIDFDPAVLTDVRLGGGFQADLPPLRPKPNTMTEQEDRLSGTLVMRAGKKAVKPRGRKSDSQSAKALREMSKEARAEVISEAMAKLAASVGSRAAAAMGLGTMGSCMANVLTPEQQERLYDGMKEHDRDFFVLARDFVPGIAPAQLAAYYYDVWKLRAIPAAQRWYDDKAAVARALEEEEKEAERKRQEDLARRAERAEAAARRRQVKEAVQWVRIAALIPTEVKYNKPVVRERATRAITMLQTLPAPIPPKLYQPPHSTSAVPMVTAP